MNPTEQSSGSRGLEDNGTNLKLIQYFMKNLAETKHTTSELLEVVKVKKQV